MVDEVNNTGEQTVNQVKICCSVQFKCQMSRDRHRQGSDSSVRGSLLELSKAVAGPLHGIWDPGGVIRTWEGKLSSSFLSIAGQRS